MKTLECLQQYKRRVASQDESPLRLTGETEKAEYKWRVYKAEIPLVFKLGELQNLTFACCSIDIENIKLECK